MNKRILSVFLVLSILILAPVASGCAGVSAVNIEPQEQSAPAYSPKKDWLPTLTVEHFSPEGAMIVFQDIPEFSDALILYGNDYFLQIFENGQWNALPVHQDQVNWVKNAFPVSSVPRDDIDWQWLYGSLTSGHYRIGKPIALQKNGETVDTDTVYAEFTLKVVNEDAGPVYDASGTEPTPPSEYDSGITKENVWESFVAAAGGEDAGTVYSAGIDSHGTQVNYTVTYDGVFYTVQWQENGQTRSVSFKQMLYFGPDAPRNYYAAERYVLTMDADVTWEDIQWDMVSDNDLDSVAHKIVYVSRSFDPHHPPVPDSHTVSLCLQGEELITLTGSKAADIASLLRKAQAMAPDPDIYYRGLDLVFQGTDGTEMVLWMDYSGDHFLYDGVYYHYDQASLFALLGIARWPQEVVDAHP